MGQSPRGRSTSKTRQMCGRNEIENYTTRRLRWVAETCLILEFVDRESLMLQRLPESRVDMFTKTGNRRRGRGFQNQGDEPSDHSRHSECLRTHTPAYRKFEDHL